LLLVPVHQVLTGEWVATDFCTKLCTREYPSLRSSSSLKDDCS
jgi:hypothetical protein